jgi:hypothetical protein
MLKRKVKKNISKPVSPELEKKLEGYGLSELPLDSMSFEIVKKIISDYLGSDVTIDEEVEVTKGS